MSQTNKTYHIGDLVTLKTHPFTNKISQIYLQSRVEYIPPILIIFEIVNPDGYNEETGEKDIQYQCIYYSTKSGIFEKKWFKHNELKLIKQEEVAESSKSNLKEWIGKQVILKSVDLELNKKKSHLDIDKNSAQKKSYHLDFSPPLLQVIGIEKNEEKKIYSKKTGEPIKNKYILKVKWFNPVKDKFTEDILPLCVLKEVDNYDSLIELIKTGDIYKFDTINITSDKNIDDIIEVKNIYFNTYTYKVEVKSLLTQKVDFKDIKVFDKIKKPESKLFSKEILGVNETGYTKVDSNLFSENKLYKIKYKDNFARITDRIIYVEEILYFDEDYKKISVTDYEQKKKDNKNDGCYTYLKAKCFLRNMETRHFQIDPDHIISVQNIILQPKEIK